MLKGQTENFCKPVILGAETEENRIKKLDT